MQVQTLAMLINDPLMMPCVASRMSQALLSLNPESALAVGVGRFERGDPYVAKGRPPVSHETLALLQRTQANLVLVAAMGATAGSLHPYNLQPFRYRNWLFTMAGSIRLLRDPHDTQLAIPSYIAKNIKGNTVPEVLFHQFLAYLHRQGLLAGERLDMLPLRKALASALSHHSVWFGEDSPDNSMFLSDGTVLLGAALNRPVYVSTIDGISECLACGGDVDGNPVNHAHVRGVVALDTQGLPSQEWQTVGPGQVFQVNKALQFESFPA
jgi:hypothetical protein